jgi:exosortase/archaeosortase family protein
VIWQVFVVAAIVTLIQLAGWVEPLAELPRSAIVDGLGWLGFEARSVGQVLEVEHLRIPWTRDCAGLSMLAVTWGAVLWLYRHAALSRRALAWSLAAVPAAFAANLARVGTVVAYRAAFYPAVESAALHYLIGMLWLLPFLLLAAPRDQRPGLIRLELLHIVAVLALVAPHAAGPGGLVVTAAAVLAAAGWQPGSRHSWLTWLVWAAAGAGLAVVNIESLWLPWLLMSPAVTAAAGYRSPLGWTLAIVAVSAPFAVSVGAGQSGPTGGPPAQVMARRTDPFTYSIRLVGQSPELEVAWVEAQGNQRHHTLPICMQYRGIALQDTAVAGVMTDGGQWLREFFLRDGQLIDTYRSYALSTLLPGTEPGVHIIIAAPRRNLGAEAFAVQASSVARRLVDLAG